MEEKSPNRKHVIVMTLNEAYSMFQTMHPYDKIGFTSFVKLKPSYVKPAKETSHKACLCSICCNTSLKAEALQKFILPRKTEYSALPHNKHQLSALSMCPYDQQPGAACLKRECVTCGTKKVKQEYEAMVE